jgi:hypothetical protein
MKLRTLKQLLNACPNDDVDIEVNVKQTENDTVKIDFAEFEYLDYGTDMEGNVVSLSFTVKI